VKSCSLSFRQSPLLKSLKTDALTINRSFLCRSLAVSVLLAGAAPLWAQTPLNPREVKPLETGRPDNQISAAASSTDIPSPLTLRAAIDLALRSQPQISNAVANRQISEERVNQTRANYYPTLTPRYSLNDSYNYGPRSQVVSGPDGVSTVTVNQAASQTVKGAQINAGVRLFDSGSRELQNRLARQSLRGSQYNEQNTYQTVIANVADSYFTALRDRALVRVSEAQVARSKNTLDVVTAQVEVGAAAPKDIFQAQADYLNAQVNLLQSRNNAANSIASLKNAIGVVSVAPVNLADVVLPSGATPTTASPDGNAPAPVTAVDPNDEAALTDVIGRYTSAAFRLRPDLAQSLQSIDQQRTNLNLAKVNAGLQAAGDLSYNNSLNPDRFNSSISNDRAFQLTLSYPLFDGGLGRAQVKQNQAAIRASEANLESLKQQVAVEVEQAYRTLAQSRAALPASQAAVAAAEKNYQAALESQREGVGSIVDVITAETALTQAQNNYFNAIYSFYAADARLARAVGQAERVAGGAGAGTDPTTAPGATPGAPAVPGVPPRGGAAAPPRANP